MLARFHGVLELLRLEAWRRSDHHEIRAGVDGMFVAIDATENAILGHIHPVVELLLITVHAVLGLLGVHIRHSDQTSIAARVPDLRNGATTTAAATDQSNTHGVAAGRVHNVLNGDLAKSRTGGHSRSGGLEEFTPTGGAFRFLAHKNGFVLGY